MNRVGFLLLLRLCELWQEPDPRTETDYLAWLCWAPHRAYEAVQLRGNPSFLMAPSIEEETEVERASLHCSQSM